MPSQKSSWLEAAWIFLLSRLAILFISAVTILRVQASLSLNYWLSWLHWDVYPYINVATQGYSQVQNTVFFPLWPLLLRGAGMLLGGSTDGYYLAGLILANLFFYLALVLLYHLLCAEFDLTVARQTLFFLAFSAYGIFFFLGYTEALFLFLSLAAFWSLRHAHYWLAGLCGFLLTLTHSQGILLLVPFVICLLQRSWPRSGARLDGGRLLRNSFPLLLIPAGLATFMLYLGITRHNPLIFSLEEAQFWHRHLTFPLWSILLTYQAFFRPLTPAAYLWNAMDLFFSLAPLAVLIAGWRFLSLDYALYSLCIILFNMSYPQGVSEPLTAAPRYMLLVFPIFIILGKWSKQPRVEQALMVCSLPLFALNTVLFVSHLWVA